MAEKLELLTLTPDELAQYRNFFQQQGQALAEVGRITMEYQGALKQAEAMLGQLIQTREQWTLRAFSSRGINPVTGKWTIDPQTGAILNETKLHVVDK